MLKFLRGWILFVEFDLNIAMYSTDYKDTVLKLTDVPQPSVRTPCPMVLAGVHHLHLAYYVQNMSAGRNTTIFRKLKERTTGQPVALVEFARVYAHMFGPPNADAFRGHPLVERGLEPYGIYEIWESSWLRGLVRMNAMHPAHRPEQFAAYHHFVFAFHDTTFECIAKSFKDTVHTGSVAEVLEQALNKSSK